MGFWAGVVVGSIATIFILIIMSCMVVAKKADKDYERMMAREGDKIN